MPAQPITRVHLLNAEIGPREVNQVEVKETYMEPGQQMEPHIHPYPLIGYILKGTAALHVEGKHEQVLKPGKAFYEPADTRILKFANQSDTEPLVYIVTYLKSGQQPLTQML